jgi:hypothetical protein
LAILPAYFGCETETSEPFAIGLAVTTRFMKRYIFLITIMYIMMPGTIQSTKPRMVRSSMNHGMGGFPSNVAVRGDWLVAFHFAVEKN